MSPHGIAATTGRNRANTTGRNHADTAGRDHDQPETDLESQLHPDIDMSWRRSASCGLTPESAMPGAPDPAGLRSHRLAEAARPVLDSLDGMLLGTGAFILLGDRDGQIIRTVKDNAPISRMLLKLGVDDGSSLAEDRVGNNGIGTALETRAGVSIRGEQHFADALKDFVCYGHPIIDPLTRRLVGAVDLSGMDHDSARMFAPFVRKIVADIEARYVDTARADDRELWHRFVERTRNSDSATCAFGDEVVLASHSSLERLDTHDMITLRRMIERDEVSDLIELSAGSVMVRSSRVGRRGHLLDLTFPTNDMEASGTATRRRAASSPASRPTVSGVATPESWAGTTPSPNSDGSIGVRSTRENITMNHSGDPQLAVASTSVAPANLSAVAGLGRIPAEGTATGTATGTAAGTEIGPHADHSEGADRFKLKGNRGSSASHSASDKPDNATGSVVIADGRVVSSTQAVVGPAGSGRTTTARSIAGPDATHVRLAEADDAAAAWRDLAVPALRELNSSQGQGASQGPDSPQGQGASQGPDSPQGQGASQGPDSPQGQGASQGLRSALVLDDIDMLDDADLRRLAAKLSALTSTPESAPGPGLGSAGSAGMGSAGSAGMGSAGGGGGVVVVVTSRSDPRPAVTEVLDACGAQTVVRPLHERGSEGVAIVERMVADLSAERSLTPPVISARFADAVCSADLPNGLGSLRSILAECLGAGVARLDVDALPSRARSARPPRSGELARGEYDAIVAALADNDGVRSRAAKRLGISRTTLYARMREFGLS